MKTKHILIAITVLIIEKLELLLKLRICPTMKLYIVFHVYGTRHYKSISNDKIKCRLYVSSYFHSFSLLSLFLKNYVIFWYFHMKLKQFNTRHIEISKINKNILNSISIFNCNSYILLKI